MTSDPIVEEVRAIREEIARSFDYDIGKIFEAFRAMERESGQPRVSLPPRRPYAEAAQQTGAPDEPGSSAAGSRR